MKMVPPVFRLLSCAYIVVFVFALAGCASTSAPTTSTPSPVARDADAALMRASVVTSGTAKLDPHLPSTISWITPVDVVASMSDAQLTLLKNIAQAAIESEIMHKGYPMLLQQGDFQMQALLVLGDNTGDSSKTGAHSELLQQTGIDPGLSGNAAAPGKGSLIIELRQGHALRWRGAVQIYLLPNTDASVVAQRIQKAVAELLLTWP